MWGDHFEVKKYKKQHNMYRGNEKVCFTKAQSGNELVEGVIPVCKEHGPYPVVVQEPLKGLTWNAWSYFYFRNIFMVSA